MHGVNAVARAALARPAAQAAWESTEKVYSQATLHGRPAGQRKKAGVFTPA